MTGGVLYSLLPRVRVPVPDPEYLLACGGVGGLVVGAGPAAAEEADRLPKLPVPSAITPGAY